MDFLGLSYVTEYVITLFEFDTSRDTQYPLFMLSRMDFAAFPADLPIFPMLRMSVDLRHVFDKSL